MTEVDADKVADQAGMLRILRPAPHVMAFYEGRSGTYDQPQNWYELGEALGTCSYAVVSGDEALVYDTHLSCAHAQTIRDAVTAEGAKHIRVVLSHHHTDHVAGNEVFADCKILANAATAQALSAVQAELEAGQPPIRPLVLPTDTFLSDHDLTVGDVKVGLRSFNIHSHDGLVLWLPQTGTLLAGDTLEDPITYVAEPEGLQAHLLELDRMAALPITRILPNHGAPDRIAEGGYAPSLIDATRRYVRWLTRLDPQVGSSVDDLRACLAEDLASGSVIYHPAYEQVHTNNIKTVRTHVNP
ncbi:MAG: MBL fold metallo-hydrolase [Pseudomonadota bacterium]